MPPRSSVSQAATIKIGGGFFVGNEVRVIAGAAGDQFAAQARVFVDFEHVDADVRHSGRDGLRKRFLPAFGRLVRQAGDQIDIDVGNSGGAQAGDVLEHRQRACAGVRPPRPRDR